MEADETGTLHGTKVDIQDWTSAESHLSMIGPLAMQWEGALSMAAEQIKYMSEQHSDTCLDNANPTSHQNWQCFRREAVSLSSWL